VKRPLTVLWTFVKVVAAVFCVGWWALHVHKLDSYLGFVLPTWINVPGLILLILGGMLVLTSGGILGSNPKEFKTSGPFRYLRNPMSLGAVMLMTGLGLYEQSISILLLGLALFLFFHLDIIYREEPGLERRFGKRYQQYKRSTNRWLPRFGGGKQNRHLNTSSRPR
jgi:protein-S-isoprenylcysteine O-methyltransferase Ste14